MRLARQLILSFAAAAPLLLSLHASPAFAQGAANDAAAQQLFSEGTALVKAGKYSEACPKLAASQRLDPGWGTAYNLADCYEKNGQSASAWAMYLEAAPLARSANKPEWAEKASAKAKALEPTLSRLTIAVPQASDVAGLVIERDGLTVDRAMWGSAIPVDPGTHAVMATAPKKQQWSTTVQVGPNAQKVEVTIPPLPVEQGSDAVPPNAPPPTVPPANPPPSQPPQPPPQAVDSNAGASQRTIGIVVAGVGVVGVAVGGVFGLLAKSSYDDARTSCTPDNRCTQAGVDGVDKARSQATLSTIAMGVGAAAVVGGAVLYFTAPSSRSALSARVSPAPGGATMSFGGAF